LAYVHEPFNIDRNNLLGLKKWFKHITEKNEDKYYDKIKKIVDLKYPFYKAVCNSRSTRDFLRALRDFSVTSIHRFKGSVPLIKDPIAVFSAEWLAKKFDLEVVVTIRHPAAFVGSIKVKGWSFPFTHFLDQPSLLNGPLSEFRDEIIAFSEDERRVLDQAILLWKCIYSTVSDYEERNKKWIFVRHEDLASEPLKNFKKVYRKMGLEFTKKAKKYIEKNSKNEGKRGSRVGIEGAINRSSQSVIKNWKKRLTDEEVKKVKKETKQVWKRYYSRDEW
jgi:hypothetical protein